MKTDQTIIEISDDERPDNRPIDPPVFSIESSKEPAYLPKRTNSGGSWGWFVAAILLLILGASGFWFFNSISEDSLKAMMTDSENLKILQSPYIPASKGVEMEKDSVLGVALELFPLAGLKASLEPSIPDTSDSTLVLFMRSADYHSDKSMIGEVVIDGKKLQSKETKSRSGYIAISNFGKPVIGISSSDKVSDFSQKNDGSFFRQYPLLANGVLPSSFELHGKVERAAIAAMPDGELFYVITPHRETMYDFADALREYGFADAVYITGGNNYSFFRSPDGNSHLNPELLPKLEKYSSTPPPSPFLVFRNK